jgi:hypothetical protein
MKKTKTRLQLSKATVRVLRESELVVVRGGGQVDAQLLKSPSNDPTACLG